MIQIVKSQNVTSKRNIWKSISNYMGLGYKWNRPTTWNI